jgi:hypothetical protein
MHIFPVLQLRRLALGQICLHGKCRGRQIKRLFVVHGASGLTDETNQVFLFDTPAYVKAIQPVPAVFAGRLPSAGTQNNRRAAAAMKAADGLTASGTKLS